MHVWIGATLWGLAPGLAIAQEHISGPVELEFVDEHDVFSVLSFDTGYLPSMSDPVSVRFHIAPTGGVISEMEAESVIAWPDPLTHTITGVPGSGTFGFDTELEMEAEVYVNIPLVYSGSIPLWTEYIRLEKVTEFDPLLLAESLQERVEVVMADSGLVDPFEVDVAIIIGVDLVFAVEVYPEVTAALEGLRIESQTPDEAWEHIAALEEVRVTPPFGGLLQVVSTYVADLTSVLAVVIEPSASVDTWIGDFDLLRFPIDVPLLDASEERAFEPVAYEHTLPELAELIDVWDFGEVAVGNVSNLSLPIENLGQHPLSGDVLIDGDLAFTVFPDAVFVPAVGEDGLTVSFAPEQVGPVQATLLVQTNDPAVPEVVIALSGSGYDPFPPDETTTTTTPTTPEATEPDDEGGGERIPEDALGSSPIQMCGCASGQNGGSSWLGLLMLVLYRRRRSAGT